MSNKSNYIFPDELISFISKEHHLNKSEIKKDCKEANEILRESKLPYLKILGFDLDIETMLAEAKNLESIMIPHRSSKEDHRGWKSITLHGISSAHTQGAEKYGLDPEDLNVYRWTDVSEMTPTITSFFKNNFYYDWYHRVRIMLLEPGGYILPHTDFNDYVLGPVNIALNNPEDCKFYMENCGEVFFEKGTINKLALVNNHCVINNSKESRFHIIIHGAPNWNYWSEVYKNSYKEMVKYD